MLIRRRRGWELRKSEATPEEVFLGRRRLLKGMAAGSILASGLGAVIFAAHYGNRDVAPQMAARPAEDDPRQASMAVPWSGFPMAAFVDFAKPLGSAKYVQMETFLDTKTAPGQTEFWYPWPYVEGLTIAEAGNELAFLVTGMYGKPVPKQDGAPLRLALPWKYGFKSVKSIVHFSFTNKRPVSFWENVQDNEYGFWANVNPGVPHPRWSQATERVLGTNERRPTLKWNGYGEFVAHLYDGLQSEA
jgi:sulfoxide reductase catalytic subunit YedY